MTHNGLEIHFQVTSKPGSLCSSATPARQSECGSREKGLRKRHGFTAGGEHQRWEPGVLPATLSNSSSFACGTAGDGQWGAHILEKLPRKLPIGPESWEGDGTKPVGA